MNQFIKIGIPSKGRMKEPAMNLLKKAGFNLKRNKRKYILKSNGIKFVFLRVRDIPKYVESGFLDAGITGYDLVKEGRCDIIDLLDLGFSKCRISVAVPKSWDMEKINQVDGDLRIATGFPNITKKFFESQGKNVNIVRMNGSCEIAPYLGATDVIVDLVSTGKTLKENGLKEMIKIMDSSARFVVNKKTYQDNGVLIMEFVEKIKDVIENENL